MDMPDSRMSLTEIESLILSLYQPNSPDVIVAAQASLSRLHSSADAWSIAQQLLQRSNEQLKFHGALIIIVKLNTDRETLSQKDANDLLGRLIDWFLLSLRQNNGMLVTRKLSAALATYFIQLHSSWPAFLPHLIVCLAFGSSCSPTQLKEGYDVNNHLERFDDGQMLAALWVTSNIMEEASKLDMNAQSSVGIYQIIQQNLPDTVLLIKKALCSQAASPQLQQDSIKCLQSLVSFAQKSSSRDQGTIDILRPLITTIVERLPYSNSADASMEFLEDILSNHSFLLTEHQYSMLSDTFSSRWSQQLYQKLLGEDSDFESLLFGQLLLAFADAKMKALVTIEDERRQALLASLCHLLTAVGQPVVDDRIFVPVVEFWSTFAETVTDEMDLADGEPCTWVASATHFVLEAVSHAWQRTAFPPADQLNQWDADDRVGFHDARNDVLDLLQSTYPLTGPRLIFNFAELALGALSSSAWLTLEAALFCLCGLADCAKEDTRCDDALSSVFSSSLFSQLQDNGPDVPPKVRQTCVSLIEHYADYFQRNTSQLPSALNLLFALVEDPLLRTPVSKSIFSLCSSCRRHLHPEMDAFLNHYQDLSSQRQLDCSTSERIIGAIASVAEALPDGTVRHATCSRLLRIVQMDVARSLELYKTPMPEELPCAPGSRCIDDHDHDHPALHYGRRALRCLLSIARGFQAPATEMSLGGEVSNVQGEPDHSGLLLLQKEIVSIILQVQSMFSMVPEVIENICSILRAGFSEAQPGPFVLPANDVAQYLTNHLISTPRTGLLVRTASSFASSLHNRESQQKHRILSDVLLWVIGLIRQLPDPETDPELSQSAIDFASRIISKDAIVFFNVQPPTALEFLFHFTLRVLDGKEPLPKAAAAEFWAVFVSLKGSNADVRNAGSQAMRTLGPLLCQSLARNFGGNASRSELDHLSEPLKRLVVRQSSAKSWLDDALADVSFPSSKVTAEQKSLFVKKVISLRGSRPTNQVVREFWLSARGSNFSYAS